MNEYNASSIKILDGVELAEVPYMKIETTAKKYGKNLNIIRCTYKACQLAKLDFDDFYIAKYSKGNDIPKNEDYLTIYVELRSKELN